MNKFKESELPGKFASDQYQVLIVAEKYQTGFDQPLLHTMYIDKKLSGVKAVQTLSRLNRIHKGKDDTFILDFVNKAEDIQEAFKPYYETTVLEETIDPNILYDIETRLDAYGVWDPQNVDEFVELYMKPKDLRKTSDGAKMNALIDPAVVRYADLEEDKQDDFKSKASRFTRLYSFILQITLFRDVALHKLFIYLRYLMKKLPKAPLGARLDLHDEISLDFYRNEKIFEGDISLGRENTDSPLTPVKFAGTSKKKEGQETLSTIIEKLNLRFGTNFTAADQLSIEQIKEDFASNEELVKNAKANSLEDFELAYTKAFDNIVVDQLEQNQSFFTKILNEDDFKAALMKLMLVETYNKLKVSS